MNKFNGAYLKDGRGGERKPRQILAARPIGKRGRGRPRKTWEDMIEELGRQKGKTVREKWTSWQRIEKGSADGPRTPTPEGSRK